MIITSGEMPSTGNQPPSSQQEKGDRLEAGKESLADCLLSQYRLCAAGIGLGTAYSLKYKKGLVPMIAAGAVGTTADMVYAYLKECAHLTDIEEDTMSSMAKSTSSDDTSST